MHPRQYKPLIIALLANGFLWLALTELNHHLAGWSITLLLPAAFVLFAGLNLGYLQGLTACMLTGLLQDAALPVPYGFFTLALPTLHLAFHRLRSKLHKKGGFGTILLAQVLNFGVLILLAISLSYELTESIVRHLPLILLQVFLSQILLFLIGLYFLEIQRKLATLAGAGLVDAKGSTT
jgi:hypothetical protein